MESLDLRLLRALFVGEEYSLRGIDPRCSILGLARKVGVSRLTVSRRLARWRADGFWKGIIAYPNADALGARFQLQPLLLEDPRARDRFETAIQEVLAPLLAFQIEALYGVLSLTEPPRDAARRQRAFERLSGHRIGFPHFEVPFPSSDLPLTARDWKILRALRQYSEPDWTRIAADVGMTVRGLERRVKRLMSANALFFQPLVDFRRLPVSVAWVTARYGTDVDPHQFWDLVKARHPDVLRVEPAVPPEMLRLDESRPPSGGTFSFFLSVPSGSSADAVRREIAQLPGALDVVVGFPTQNMTAPGELDDRIARAAAGTRPPG